jgi:hypothetical protein
MAKEKVNLSDFSKPVLEEFIRQHICFGLKTWLKNLRQIERQMMLDRLIKKDQELARQRELFKDKPEFADHFRNLLDRSFENGKKISKLLAEV